MITFTVFGFLTEGERFFDFNLDVLAESPIDAMDKVLRKHTNLSVSSICRSSAGRLLDY
jgi:hypothetical protein